MQVERGPLRPLEGQVAAKVVVGVGQVFEMDFASAAASPGPARLPLHALAWRAAVGRVELVR